MDLERFDALTRRLASRETRRRAIKTLFAGGAGIGAMVATDASTAVGARKVKPDCCPATNPLLCGLTCTDTNSDEQNCGGCGTVCTPIQTCTNGVCVAPPCDDNTCPDPPNAAGACNDADVCTYVCNPGFADCDTSAANGCEINLSTDPNHCGDCGTVCSANNGTPSCIGGECAIAFHAGFGNCSAGANDGCETNLNSDLSNCGGCGNACSTNHATPSCTSGICTFACESGFANCNLDPADGCETNVSSNVTNCGACGFACSASNGTPSCLNGACAITCNAGFANCNNDAIDGCEVNIQNDDNNCGACNAPCAGDANCVNSVCE